MAPSDRADPYADYDGARLVAALAGTPLTREEAARTAGLFVAPESRRSRLAPKPAEGIIQDALQRMPDEALLRLERDLETLLKQAKVRSRPATMKPLADP